MQNRMAKNMENAMEARAIWRVIQGLFKGYHTIMENHWERGK